MSYYSLVSLDTNYCSIPHSSETITLCLSWKNIRNLPWRYGTATAIFYSPSSSHFACVPLIYCTLYLFPLSYFQCLCRLIIFCCVYLQFPRTNFHHWKFPGTCLFPPFLADVTAEHFQSFGKKSTECILSVALDFQCISDAGVYLAKIIFETFSFFLFFLEWCNSVFSLL